MNYIEQYLQQIQRGKCIVSKRVRREYERLADDIKHPKKGYVFDPKKAERPAQHKRPELIRGNEAEPERKTAAPFDYDYYRRNNPGMYL